MEKKRVEDVFAKELFRLKESKIAPAWIKTGVVIRYGGKTMYQCQKFEEQDCFEFRYFSPDKIVFAGFGVEELMKEQSMGRFVYMKDRAPEARGEYSVWRRAGKLRGMVEADHYFWNGSGWVTPGGSPTESVIAWLDPDADDGEEKKDVYRES